MSQAEFARAYGIGKRALQEWEQGGRQPDSTALIFYVIAMGRNFLHAWGTPPNAAASTSPTCGAWTVRSRWTW
jgi:transcriptional regulator with XRE-family HTH domain